MDTRIKRKRASASSLFLMELVVAILFFTLAASLCITIFVSAHSQSVSAKTLNHAVNLCSDTAELIRASDSVADATRLLTEHYSLSTPGSKNGELFIYYDEDFEMITSNAAAHREQVVMTEEEGRLLATISFSDLKGNEVYSLSIVHAL